ncbi:hypothetical protein AXF42_Ash014036 [Apostasia shenzhenica]|uniref:Uncharacterized protein n=1 Tax=Apostasia shenzhenica TaxID=1088818 RepID=A0A2I0A965_9ASPA|nr:hypothetical protein AXF42_Ash014036 [Apostasia shenzhenica]
MNPVRTDGFFTSIPSSSAHFLPPARDLSRHVYPPAGSRRPIFSTTWSYLLNIPDFRAWQGAKKLFSFFLIP